MAHLVLGTAGHIDHGKSALVQALSGTDPDRLKEEKKRGITIELGFADLDLGAGRVVSFVDVPGHERFVRHMVAGATGVDAVLLVVAADQGVQPQTREHLEICRLLDVQNGLVVLTKCDLVETDLREVVALEVRELLEGSFLDDAPLLQVSARTGEGLDDLRGALDGLFDTVPERPAEGIPRLPVDRSFVLKGFGTVVTGTMVSGSLQEGEEVEVLPGGRRARIRGLQVHHHHVNVAVAGRRAAVNLQGLDCSEVPRGAIVTRPGALLPSRRAWVRLTLLDSAPKSLQKGGPVRFHHGTSEGPARARVLGKSEDGTLHVELRLGEPVALGPGDHYILRRPAPVDTVGGGVIVDAHPPGGRAYSAAAFEPGAIEPASRVRMRLERAGEAGCDPPGLAGEVALGRAQAEAVLRDLETAGRARRAGPRWFCGETWRDIAARALEAITAFHRDEPLRSGISREALRAGVCSGMLQEAWRELLEQLGREEKIRLEGERVALSSHAVKLSGGAKDLARKIDGRFLEAGLEPPDLAEVVGGEVGSRVGPIVELLIADGRLVRIQDGRLFHAEPLARLRETLREYARQSRTIDVGAFKQLAGVTRKNAIPLLEQLDSERITRRVGNTREILIAPANGA